MQRLRPKYNRVQRHGDLRIAHVGNVRLALHNQVVNLGMESCLHLRGPAAEPDRHAILRDFINRKPMASQPRGDRRNVGECGTKLLPHLLRFQPMMEIRRGRVILAGDKGVECFLLLRAALQYQHQARHAHGRAHRAAVVLFCRCRRRIAP